MCSNFCQYLIRFHESKPSINLNHRCYSLNKIRHWITSIACWLWTSLVLIYLVLVWLNLIDIVRQFQLTHSYKNWSLTLDNLRLNKKCLIFSFLPVNFNLKCISRSLAILESIKWQNSLLNNIMELKRMMYDLVIK